MPHIETPEEAEAYRKLLAMPFRMVVEEAFVVKGHGLIVVGQTKTGTLQKGTEILIEGENFSISTTVTRIDRPFNHDPDLKAEPDLYAGLVLRNLDETYKEKIKPGMIITKREDI